MAAMTSPSHFICLTGDTAQDRWLERGDTVLHAPSGTFIHDHGQDDLSMTVPAITGFAVVDWADVADHQTARGETTVSHCLRFHGGGELNVVFDLQGEILSLCGEGLACFTDWSGFVTVGPCRVDESAPAPSAAQ
jgi:hypothetical protein